MEDLILFFSTFGAVFVGELADKTQLASGTAVLEDRQRAWIIFAAASCALVSVAVPTALLLSAISVHVVTLSRLVGGGLLYLYGCWLLWRAWRANDDGTADETSHSAGFRLFVWHFGVVFVNELGDKSQIMTGGFAIEHPERAIIVAAGASLALVTLTAITMLFFRFIPAGWSRRVQLLGAAVMICYGYLMILGTW